MWSSASQDEPLGTETTCPSRITTVPAHGAGCGSRGSSCLPCILSPQTFCFLLPRQCQAKQQPQPFWPQQRAVPISHGQAKPGQAAPGSGRSLSTAPGGTSIHQALGKEKATTGNGIPAP